MRKRTELSEMYAMVRDLGRKKQERGAGRNQLSRGAYCLDKRLAPRVKEVRKGSSAFSLIF